MHNSKSENSDSKLSTSSLLEELANHLDAMLAYWDTNQTCLYANNAYYKWFGKKREQVIGLTMKELLGPIYEKNLPYIEGALHGNVQTFEREIPSPDGSIRHSLTTYTPYIHEGEVLGFFVHVVDVTPLKQLENELREAKEKSEQLATHDFLTGLPNRVLLNDRICQALNIAQRTNKFIAVISLDIDDFKLINDSHGHLIGDQFLIEIANRINNSLRNLDTVTRMGGDEFLILATEIESTDQLRLVAERILNNIKVPFVTGSYEITPSCSLGITFNVSRQADPQILISESDKALYIAKSRGKGQYVITENQMITEP